MLVGPCVPTLPKPTKSSASGTRSTLQASSSAGWRPKSPVSCVASTRPTFAPHIDTGDHVIVVNAAQVVMTAAKATRSSTTRYSGYPGGHQARSYSELLAKRPEEVVRIAVRGMLPKGPLGARCSASSRSTPAPSTTTPPRHPSPGPSTTRLTGSPEQPCRPASRQVINDRSQQPRGEHGQCPSP